MKYLTQFTIIGTITFLGEVLNCLLPFPVPSSVYGMLLLFLALLLKIIKLEQVEDTADFFVTIMPVFFVGPAVGMIDTLPGLKGNILPILLITVVTTVLVMAVTGIVAQTIIRMGKRKGK